ncbi:MAG: cobyrinate a,c-diamide synthase [candidate division NC10 bacterium]|nr:cobyrinate a,c-diamide synthase [candidate division NC10 bacterium]
MHALLVGGVASGVGKTTVTLGLMAALRRRGLRVQGFKVGPDFIDAGLHAAVTDRPSHNLDGWLLPRAEIEEIFARHTADADVALVEGVMGLFDGLEGGSDRGSSAEIARWLHLPVLLVVDASAAIRSAAATLLGFETFDSSLRMAGVVFNRAGGPRHAGWLREASALTCRTPILGALPWETDVRIPERHLGLVTAETGLLTPERVGKLADLVEAHVDVDQLLEASRLAAVPSPSPPHPASPGRRCRIGVARDAAFCFYYAENLTRLEAAGASLVPFSPLRDPKLPEGLDGLYLGGGYPEVHAADLAANVSMRDDIRAHATAGCPVYAECGGLMYLSRSIETLDQRRHAMVGLLPTECRMLERRRMLGYAEVTLRQDSLWGTAGSRLRGHEFHYSEMTATDEPPDGWQTAYAVCHPRPPGPVPEGFQRERVLASYVHLHLASQPGAVRHFLRKCTR